jgi:Glycosyl-transferase for dystroglycan
MAPCLDVVQTDADSSSQFESQHCTQHQDSSVQTSATSETTGRGISSGKPPVPCAAFPTLVDATPYVRTDSDNCDAFRRIALMRRQTHPYFVVGTGVEEAAASLTSTSETEIDVTMATQLTIDRFPALERMLTRWEGPASVAFHVTREEASQLPSKISSSAALKNRTRVSYHVIYKRAVRFTDDADRNKKLRKRKQRTRL